MDPIIIIIINPHERNRQSQGMIKQTLPSPMPKSSTLQAELNSLPNNKILDQSKLKAFADNRLTPS